MPDKRMRHIVVGLRLSTRRLGTGVQPHARLRSGTISPESNGGSRGSAQRRVFAQHIGKNPHLRRAFHGRVVRR